MAITIVSSISGQIDHTLNLLLVDCVLSSLGQIIPGDVLLAMVCYSTPVDGVVATYPIRPGVTTSGYTEIISRFVPPYYVSAPRTELGIDFSASWKRMGAVVDTVISFRPTDMIPGSVIAYTVLLVRGVDADQCIDALGNRSQVYRGSGDVGIGNVPTPGAVVVAVNASTECLQSAPGWPDVYHGSFVSGVWGQWCAARPMAASLGCCWYDGVGGGPTSVGPWSGYTEIYDYQASATVCSVQALIALRPRAAFAATMVASGGCVCGGSAEYASATPDFGTASVSFVGVTGAESNSSSGALPITCALTGVQAGDLVVALAAVGNAGDIDVGVSTAGYTELCDVYSGNIYSTNLSAAYKVMGSTPDSSVSFYPASMTSSTAIAGLAVILRGINPAQPIDVPVVTAVGSGSAKPNCPAITPASPGALLLLVGSSSRPQQTPAPTPPSGYSSAGYARISNTAADSGSALVAAHALWGGGTVDPGAWTGVYEDMFDSWAAVSIAVRPKSLQFVLSSLVSTGGAVCGGSSGQAFVTSLVASGGCVCGGSADSVFIASAPQMIAIGGAICGGYAPSVWIPSGPTRVAIGSSWVMVTRSAQAIERGWQVVRQERGGIEVSIDLLRASAVELVDQSWVMDRQSPSRTPIEAAIDLIALDSSLDDLRENRVSWSVQVSGAVDCHGRPVADGTMTDPGPIWLDPLTISLSIDRSAYIITGSMELADGGAYAACLVGRALTITLGGQTVVLRISDRRRSRRHGAWTYTIDATSPAAWLDAPWSGLATGEYAGMASTMASAIVAASPYAVDLAWQTVDWSIPVDTLTASGSTPLALLRTLKDSCGAVMLSELDGSLTIEPEYPVAVPSWEDTLPDLEISAGAEVINMEEDEEWRDGTNAYLVASEAAASVTDQLRLSDIDGEDGTKIIRVAAVPWREDISLTHSGGDWVQLALIGDVQRDETELITVVDGVGQSQYPLQQIVSATWMHRDLGAITADESGRITAAISGDSLLSLTYATLARQWQMRNPQGDEVLVTATAGDTATGSGVSVLVTRGGGDRQGADVVDSLLTSTVAAVERGRNLIDASSTPRQMVSLSVPFSGLHRTGQLVRVLDVEQPPWVGMLRRQDLSITVADDGVQAWDTTLTVEREAMA